MDCPEENVIVDLVRGELPKPERQALEAHIDECGACAQLVAEMARIFADDEPEVGSRPPTEVLDGEAIATDGAFSPTIASLAGTSSRIPEPLLPQGAKLGRYVVIDRVGAGGMGVVYAAYDPELDRKVALKVLRFGGGKPQVRTDQKARLVREAQAMAKLSHPNVITVHDVGTFEEQVFLAMEFIDGGTLSKWLETPRTWREVLKVLRAAGEGLEAAHEVGLVHRDFKPDNVLLGSDGRVLVTDFGLARTAAGNTGRFADLSQAEHHSGLLDEQLTQTGALVGTPAYMAPEQLHGRSTNALTDQFSFCVALYEALYGERPFEGGALVELVHNVSEGKIRPPPRDAAVPRWLRRAVLHGLAVEPTDRYPTMRSLLDAMRRDPWRKWRRWGSVTIPTAVLAVGIIAYQQVERSEQGYCDRVAGMLEGVWDDARQSAISEAFLATERPYAEQAFEAARQAMDEYAAKWVDLQADACRDELRAEQPQAVIALRMDCLQRRLGSLGALSDLLADADAETVAAAADAVNALPSLEMCSDLEALTERVELIVGEEAREAADEIDRMSMEASVLAAAAKYDDAQKLAEQVLEHSRTVGYRRGEAEGLFMLGRIGLSQGDRAEAETAFHRALSASLAAGHSAVMAKASVGLVWIAGDEGRSLDESERWATHGLAALEQLGGDPRIEAQLYQALAVARHRAGKLQAADHALVQGLTALEATTVPDERTRAGLLTAKGTLAVTRRDFEAALDAFSAAFESLVAAYGETHPHVATGLDNRGVALARLGRMQEALELHQQALEIREAAFGQGNIYVGGSHQNLSNALAKMGDHEAALAHAKKSVQNMRAQAADKGSLELVSALAQRAHIETDLRDFDAARASLEEALAMAVDIGGESHPKAIEARLQLGHVLLRANRPERARTQLEKGLELHGELYSERDSRSATTHAALAEALVLLGKYEDAAKHGETALEIAEEVSSDEGTAAARFALARALVNTSPPDPERARSLAEQARKHYEATDPATAIRIGTWLAEHS